MCALCFDGKGSIVEFGKFVILCHYSASVHFFIIQGPKHRPRSDADLHVFAIASSFFQLWPSIDIFNSYFFSFDEILSKSCWVISLSWNYYLINFQRYRIFLDSISLVYYYNCENKELPVQSIETKNSVDRRHVGETGVKWDTGSKGTVGGKIVDVNKTLKFLVCYVNLYNLLRHEILLIFVNNCMSYWQN
jgi:hypothetical protein